MINFVNVSAIRYYTNNRNGLSYIFPVLLIWSCYTKWLSYWRHQMEIYSLLLTLCAGNSPVTGEFPSQRSVTRSFNVSFHLRLNKRLSKQSRGWWFETPSRSLWRHCSDNSLSVRHYCLDGISDEESNKQLWQKVSSVLVPDVFLPSKEVTKYRGITCKTYIKLGIRRGNS